MLGLRITTMRCSILSHKAYTLWWSGSRWCDLATSCLAFFRGHFANSCVQCKLSHPRATIYIFGVFSKLNKTKDICQASQIYAKCLWQNLLSLFPFDHLVVEFDGLDAYWTLYILNEGGGGSINKLLRYSIHRIFNYEYRIKFIGNS
jgi:hypothetical protein